MIDTATVSAIASRTKDVIDASQGLVIAITGAITAVASIVSFIVGHFHGKACLPIAGNK
jgi:hypothetical protein